MCPAILCGFYSAGSDIWILTWVLYAKNMILCLSIRINDVQDMTREGKMNEGVVKYKSCFILMLQ